MLWKPVFPAASSNRLKQLLLWCIYEQTEQQLLPVCKAVAPPYSIHPSSGWVSRAWLLTPVPCGAAVRPGGAELQAGSSAVWGRCSAWAGADGSALCLLMQEKWTLPASHWHLWRWLSVHLWWNPGVLDTSSQKIPIRNGVVPGNSSFPVGNISKSYIENVFRNIEFRAFCLWGMAAVSLKLWAPLFKLWSLSRGCAALLSQMPGLEPQSFGAFGLGGIETPMFSVVVSVEIFHKKTCPNGISTLVRPDELWKQLSAFQCCSVQAWAHPCSRSINELCVPGALMP